MRALGLQHWTRSAALGFIVTSCAVAAAAAESAPAVSLEWLGSGPENGCLGAAGLERAVTASLGRSAAFARSGERRVVVRVEPREEFGWRAVVRVEDREGRLLGERELVSEGAACSRLDEPLAFMVALMIDGDLSPALSPEAAATRAPERKPRAERSSASKLRRPESRRSSVALEAALLGALGLLPEPTLGVEAGVELTPWTWLGLHLRATSLLPRSRTVDAAEARFGLYYASLGACPSLETGRLRYGPCFGLHGGVVSVVPDGFEAGEADLRQFLAGSFALAALLRTSRGFGLSTRASVLVPYRRERFVYDAEQQRHTLFEMSKLCLLLSIGGAFEL